MTNLHTDEYNEINNCIQQIFYIKLKYMAEGLGCIGLNESLYDLPQWQVVNFRKQACNKIPANMLDDLSGMSTRGRSRDDQMILKTGICTCDFY